MALLSLRRSSHDNGRLIGMLWVAGALAAAAMLGVLITSTPRVTLVLSLGSLVLASAVRFPDAACRLFVTSMSILLAGYVALGRGFAHVGVAPIYVGEVVLGLGFLALFALLVSRRLKLPRSPLLWILLVYMAWGFVRTLPYLGRFGVDAVRDAVLWGYGTFVFLLVPHLLPRERLESVVARYGRWAYYILPWLPIGLALSRLTSGSFTTINEAEGFDNFLKAGDVGVHLGGLAAFQLLALQHNRSVSPLRTGAFAIGWLLTFGVVAGTNRGGTLAAIAAILAVAVTTRGRVARQLASAAFLAVVVVTVLVVTEVSVDLGSGRKFSASQMVANFQSIAGGSGDESLDGTRRWRLSWWNDIVSYTVKGPYFWTGKGFGINLADDDGYTLDQTGALRSPHNGHMTVLARSGVPGLSLWVLLQIVFAVTVLRARWLARRVGDDRLARLLLWVLAYWIATVINASFDVYLEGPQGGIWYWSILAAGIVLAESVRGRTASSPTEPRPQSV